MARFQTSLLALALVGLFTTGSLAEARENHCDHNNGRKTGTVIGGILGAGIAAIAGGNTGEILAGAGGGAVAGNLIGDGEDDRRDWDECGPDAASVRRADDRRYERDQRRYERETQRSREIEMDRERARYERSRGERYGRDQYPFACVRDRYGFAVVHIPSDRIVADYGRHESSCIRAAVTRSDAFRRGY